MFLNFHCSYDGERKAGMSFGESLKASRGDLERSGQEPLKTQKLKKPIGLLALRPEKPLVLSAPKEH
jgi:hypothetical protein